MDSILFFAFWCRLTWSFNLLSIHFELILKWFFARSRRRFRSHLLSIHFELILKWFFVRSRASFGLQYIWALILRNVLFFIAFEPSGFKIVCFSILVGPCIAKCFVNEKLMNIHIILRMENQIPYRRVSIKYMSSRK